MHALRRGDKAVWKTHAPGKRSRNAVISIAREQAADASDGVADAGSGRADVQKFENGNFYPARQNYQSNKSAEKSAEPGKAVAADELWPGVREELVRTFENVVEPRADQSGKSRDSNDQKSFVFFVSGGNAFELRSATIEIGLQDVRGGEHAEGNHQPKSGDAQRSEMQERDHV